MNNNNNNNTIKDRLVDTHFDNMESLERARGDYIRKSENVVEHYNMITTGDRPRLELENLIERKRNQDQILADGVVQANSVYDHSRNPNADNIEDEINMRVERRILDDMRAHKEIVEGLIQEMEEISGNNLTQNPDSSQTLREVHNKLEQSSQRYEDWITRSDMTLDQYYTVDRPHLIPENTTQPDLPVPAPFSDSDSESDFDSYSDTGSESGSNVSEELSENISQPGSDPNLSSDSWETISDSDEEEVAQETIQEASGEVREEITEKVAEETTVETTEKTLEDTVESSAKDPVEDTSNPSEVDTHTSSSSNTKRKRDESEELEEESYINPTKRLKDTDDTNPEEDKKVEVGLASENVVASSSVTADLSPSRKRKRDDEENSLEQEGPKEKKEKSSLLDDFADLSSEPADYFGGDD